MRRLTFIGFLLALILPGSAAAYPWPVKPFNKQHPVRANFGDPRTIFEMSLFQSGLEGPGSFRFHNGIDISAPDGTSVYPVVSGTVKSIDGDTISVTTEDNRVFQYYHLIPVVADGEKVVAKQTLLGYIQRAAGHVHLAEIRGFKVWNPLAKGGLSPYRDTVKPHVTGVYLRGPGSLAPLDPLGVCGTVSIVAEASDIPQVKVTGSFAGLPVSPALVAWTMRKVAGAVYQPLIAAADFRTTLPPTPEFWSVYARGTYQNAPRFGNRQFALMPGRYLYNLNTSFDTRTVPNGVYQVTARAEDIRGHAASLAQRFTIVNQAGTETGCPPTPAPPAPPAP